MNPDWATMDTGSVAYDIFDSPQLREYYMRLAQGHTGIYPDQPQHLMITLHTLGSMLGGLPISISAGGTHNIAHALQRALMEEGGDFFVLSEVDKIIIEGNRAKGIKLVDGTEIEAKKMVICNTNVYQMVDQFIGHENTPASIVEKVKKVHSDMGAWWFWATYHELPKYIHHEAKYPEMSDPETVHDATSSRTGSVMNSTRNSRKVCFRSISISTSVTLRILTHDMPLRDNTAVSWNFMARLVRM